MRLAAGLGRAVPLPREAHRPGAAGPGGGDAAGARRVGQWHTASPAPAAAKGGQAQVPRASSQNSQAGRAGTVSEAAGTDAPRLGILSGCGSFLPRGRARAAAGRKGQRGGQRRV